MTTINSPTVSDVASGLQEHTHLGLGLEFATRDRFSKALFSIGYRAVRDLIRREKSGMAGTWSFYLRENYVSPSFLPRENGDVGPPSAAVAFYHPDGTSDEKTFLFMTKRGTSPDLEEMVRNARVISSGLLENRIILALISRITQERAIRCMPNSANYIYGKEAAQVIRDDFVDNRTLHNIVQVAELAYAYLIRLGVTEAEVGRGMFWDVFMQLRAEEFSLLSHANLRLTREMPYYSQIVGAIAQYASQLRPTTLPAR